MRTPLPYQFTAERFSSARGQRTEGLYRSVVSKNFDIRALFVDAAEGVFDFRVIEVALYVDEETVFPLAAGDGERLDEGHIYPVEDEVGEHTIEASADVRELHTKADFVSLFCIYFIGSYHDKTCGIVFFGLDVLCYY